MANKRVLCRISIPPRLRDEMMLHKHGNAMEFDVPRTDDGSVFMQWWTKASSADRDDVMRSAYNNNVGIVDALKTKLDGECGR